MGCTVQNVDMSLIKADVGEIKAWEREGIVHVADDPESMEWEEVRNKLWDKRNDSWGSEW